MSYGFGKLQRADYDKIKAGGRGVRVDPADYLGRLVGVNKYENNEEGKQSAYFIDFILTDDNAQNAGSKVTERVGFYPVPNSEKQEMTNSIAHQGISELIDAAGVEVHVDGEGYVDLVATLQSLPQMEPVVKFTVVHDGEYQNLKNFRSAS